jgi:hypothetical protein
MIHASSPMSFHQVEAWSENPHYLNTGWQQRLPSTLMLFSGGIPLYQRRFGKWVCPGNVLSFFLVFHFSSLLLLFYFIL